MPGYENERLAALTHLEHSAKGDVIVYDRGYYSFAMALAHQESGRHFVFRIKKKANPTFDDFIASNQTDLTVTVNAPEDERALQGRTLRVRLVRYTVGDTEYRLATSLLDSNRYGIQPLSDLYHGRWGVEELYKVGKDVIGDFHAQSERGVCQEIYAAFVLLTMTRWLSNRCDSDLNVGGDESDMPAMRANFRNALRLVRKEIEALFLKQAEAVRAQLSKRIETTKEQMGEAKNRLTPTTALKTGPGFRLSPEARSLFLFER